MHVITLTKDNWIDFQKGSFTRKDRLKSQKIQIIKKDCKIWSNL